MADGHIRHLETDDRYRLLIDSITDYAIYMLDTQGRVISWNPGAERVKGYAPAEIIGKHVSLFYTPEDRNAGEPQRGLDVAEREGRFEKEGWRVRKSGERFWANVVIDAIRDENGRLRGFAKITRDISEKRLAQIELAGAREELFQAQKMEAIGQLTGGIAHDFNNLLMAILGSLQILQKRLPHDPQTTPLINNAIRGAERGAALTKRLLAFARRQDLDVRAVDVCTLITDMVELVRRSLPPTIIVEIDCETDLLPVLTDGNQLETALINLIVNARDALPAGGVIKVSARTRDLPLATGKLREGTYIELSVADNGEGMDPKTLERATIPFFTTKGVGKGTGLGLSMVQGLTEQSGGELRLTSAPGQGTTVSLLMPAVLQTEDADAKMQGSKPMNEEKANAHRPMTVLAVDDDALVLMNTTLMLEDLGHTVIEAYNGLDALSVIESGKPIDIVVTDHSMPKMTGAELAARILALRPGMPIILATGYAELPSGDEMQLPRLPKPFSQEQLRDLLINLSPPQ